MFERFTEAARRVIFFARYEGSRSGSPYMETEHLLLGLLRQDKQLANRFLHSHAAADSIRKQIEGHTLARENIATTSVDMPLSNECKRVLAYAAEESERLNHKHLGTEHLLLGLLRQENCLAAEILQERGLSVSSVREELRTSMMPSAGVEHPAAPLFTLTAAEPKLKTADPSNVTGVHEGPGPDGKDPRIGNPAAGRLVTCQNMTMAQFAECLPRIAPGYIRRGTVVDATGLDGAWDFTISFSPAGMERRGGWDVEAGRPGTAPGASETGGPVSLFEAIEQQLGLKLQTTWPPAPLEAPKGLPFRFAEILFRATVLARKAGASEIGIDMLLLAMDSDAGPGLSDIDALLATFASAVPDYALGLPNGESVGGFDASVALGLSGEVQGILAHLDKHMTTEALRLALIFAKSNRTETGDEP